MRSPVVRASLIAVLVALPTFALPLGSAEREDLTPVHIVVAESPNGLPEQAADELRALLVDVGGLRAVTLARAATREAFLDELAATNADVLVVFGHGDISGIDVQGTRAAWRDVAAAIARSDARDVYVGACDSYALGEIAGKRVRTTFQGEIDADVVAPQVASDLFLDLLPTLDAEFEPRFLEYVEARGGLDHYARLMIAPQHPLAPDCGDKLEAWYGGEKPASKGECIFYMSPNSTNCHAEQERNVPPCSDLTAGDQKAWSEGSTPSASASYTDGDSGAEDFSEAYWDRLARVFGVEVDVFGGTLNIEVGSHDNTCRTILKLEELLAGGTTYALRLLVQRLTSRSIAPIAADGSALAFRVCGAVQVFVPQFGSTTEEVQIKAVGELDLRATTYGEIMVKIPVFRWSRDLKVDIEGGFSYPLRAGVEGTAGRCYDPHGRVVGAPLIARIPVEGGEAGIFVEAQAGYVGLGWRRDFGGDFSHTFEFRGRCPAGTTENDPNGGQSADASVGVEADIGARIGDANARLVAAGLAVVNAAPTTILETEEGTTSLVSGFLVLRPGSGTFHGHAASGALDKLGIPRDLSPTLKAIVDVTHPRVIEALGSSAIPPTPLVSLVDGVAIVPAVTPAGLATEGLCENVNAANFLLVKACADVSFEPIPVVRDNSGVSFLAPQLGGIDTSLATDPAGVAASAAHGVACTGSVEYICRDARRIESAPGIAFDLSLLQDIHDTFLIVERPLEVVWMLSGCALSVGGVQVVEDTNYAPVAYFDPDGTPHMDEEGAWTHCLTIESWGGVPELDLQAVEKSFTLGQAVLVQMAQPGPAAAVLSHPLDTWHLVGQPPDVLGEIEPIVCPFLPGCA